MSTRAAQPGDRQDPPPQDPPPRDPPPQDSTQQRPTLLSVALALLIGTFGGWIAYLLALPLAWMIGAMLATTAAAASGVRVALPAPLRAVMVAVLGVMLGSGFTPEILPRLGEWSLSLTALIGYILVSGAASLLYFRRVANYDRVTAYFSAMPGGLSEMILVGGEMGGDSRIISLIHASRVLLVVLVLPFAFQLLIGYDTANGDTRPTVSGPPLLSVPLVDLALLGACGVVGFFAAKAMRLPAAAVVGPMILSAAVHLAGWTEAAPPFELVAAAQVIVGTAIGCRFAGVGARFMARTVAVAAGGTTILLAVTVAFAFMLHAATDLPPAALVLAFAPGGLAEMSLIALALSLETAFVATHHIVRIFLIVVLAPVAFNTLRRGFRAKSSKHDDHM